VEVAWQRQQGYRKKKFEVESLTRRKKRKT
jgi:hypothetical protein